MTDAPNFGTKFGWRKPCLRYIDPLLGTTSGASVGRGDHTPPPPACSTPCRGAGSVPPRRERHRFAPISVGSEHLPTPRRGGPMCPPVSRFREKPCPGRHIGRPLRILLQSPPSRDNGRGQSPAPTDSMATSINPGKTGYLSAKPANQFSIINYQLSIFHSQSSSIRGLSWKRSR